MRLTMLFLMVVTGVFAQENKDINSEDMAKAMKEMQNAFQQMNQATADVEVIGFRELKKVLPDEVIGVARSKASGEKNATMGMKVSKAKGEYGTRGQGPHLTLEIIDTGTLKGIMGMSLAGWTMMEVDRESDTEMEQTFSYKGYKGYKKYHFERKDGEVSLILGGRVVVQVKLWDVSFEQIEKALESLDFKGIEALVASVSHEEKKQ